MFSKAKKKMKLRSGEYKYKNLCPIFDLKLHRKFLEVGSYFTYE